MSNSVEASVSVENASIVFPIYGTKSIKTVALRKATSVLGNRLGGKINIGSDNNVYVEALTDVTFSIGHGERIGLMGHNGSGKSTLLRALAKVYAPVSGKVETVGSVCPFLDLSMGMDMEMTGYENISLRGLMLGLTKKEVASYADEIAEFSELGSYLEMPMRTYSSGMLMRLAFTVSTLVNPDILLMDEWISVGDQDFQQKAQNRLNDLVERSKILVLASHSQELLKSICTRIIHLEHGKIANIYEAPFTF